MLAHLDHTVFSDEVELSMASYDETNREVVCGRTAVVRFSNSYIRDNTEVRPYYPLMITVAFGKQQGMAVANQIEPAAIRAAVRNAEAIAKAARPNDDHLPPLGQQHLRAGQEDLPEPTRVGQVAHALAARAAVAHEEPVRAVDEGRAHERLGGEERVGAHRRDCSGA